MLQDIPLMVESEHLDLQTRVDVFDLWNMAYPKNIALRLPTDFDNYLNKLSDLRHAFIRGTNNQLIAWYADFIRNNSRWFALIIHPDHHGHGFGKHFMNHAFKQNTELNGWVVTGDQYIRRDGKPYVSPLGFYEKLGFANTKETFISDTLETVHVKWIKGL